MSKNYLIAPEFLDNAKKIIESWTLEEKATNYALLEKELDNIKKMIREQLLSGNNKEIIINVNGINKVVKVIKGVEKTTTEKIKNIDYDKAVEFAKQNRFHIPFTAPQIDYSKIENEEWFQNNIEKFVEVKEQTYTKKSYDKILISDKKC